MNHDDRGYYGFWVYLMSDCVLFAGLFATYAVLHTETFGGPTSSSLFDLSFVLKETLVLLTSSFVCGLTYLAARDGKARYVVYGLLATLALGLAFLFMEVSEFAKLAGEGAGWTVSAFLSSYFTLVGTHGLHVFMGCLWMLVLLLHLSVRGLTAPTVRRLAYFSLFWHFLDIIWIFIFTIVYLMGVY
jgi:cytochrome o ubiquinol oxidase subunit 3